MAVQHAAVPAAVAAFADGWNRHDKPIIDAQNTDLIEGELTRPQTA